MAEPSILVVELLAPPGLEQGGSVEGSTVVVGQSLQLACKKNSMFPPSGLNGLGPLKCATITESYSST